MDDNLFDEDDALDYIIYEECEKDANRAGSDNNEKGGCLGVVALALIPASGGLLLWRSLSFLG